MLVNLAYNILFDAVSHDCGSTACNEVHLIDLKLRDYSMKLCEPQAMKELNKGTH